MLNEYEEARQRYEEARKVYHTIGHRLGEANTFLGLGRLCRAEGKHAEGRTWLLKAEALYAAIGITYWASIAGREAAALE
jgi:hypothetical protein